MLISHVFLSFSYVNRRFYALILSNHTNMNHLSTTPTRSMIHLAIFSHSGQSQLVDTWPRYWSICVNPKETKINCPVAVFVCCSARLSFNLQQYLFFNFLTLRTQRAMNIVGAMLWDNIGISFDSQKNFLMPNFKTFETKHLFMINLLFILKTY